MGMAAQHCILPIIALSVVLGAPRVAASGNMEQEYQQVRKIALRDPRVRAAYEDAERKLDEKILQIDPALAGYHHQRSTEPQAASASHQPVAHSKPVSVPEGSGQRMSWPR